MPHHEMQNWRDELQNLDWSQGFTKEDLMQRFPNIPQQLFQNVPSGRNFYSCNEFWTMFQPTGAAGGTMGGTTPTGGMGGPTGGMGGQTGGMGGQTGGPGTTGR